MAFPIKWVLPRGAWTMATAMSTDSGVQYINGDLVSRSGHWWLYTATAAGLQTEPGAAGDTAWTRIDSVSNSEINALIADWAEEGDTTQIPADKLGNAGSAGAGFLYGDDAPFAFSTNSDTFSTRTYTGITIVGTSTYITFDNLVDGSNVSQPAFEQLRQILLGGHTSGLLAQSHTFDMTPSGTDIIVPAGTFVSTGQSTGGRGSIEFTFTGTNPFTNANIANQTGFTHIGAQTRITTLIAGTALDGEINGSDLTLDVNVPDNAVTSTSPPILVNYTGSDDSLVQGAIVSVVMSGEGDATRLVEHFGREAANGSVTVHEAITLTIDPATGADTAFPLVIGDELRLTGLETNNRVTFYFNDTPGQPTDDAPMRAQSFATALGAADGRMTLAADTRVVHGIEDGLNTEVRRLTDAQNRITSNIAVDLEINQPDGSDPRDGQTAKFDGNLDRWAAKYSVENLSDFPEWPSTFSTTFTLAPGDIYRRTGRISEIYVYTGTTSVTIDMASEVDAFEPADDGVSWLPLIGNPIRDWPTTFTVTFITYRGEIWQLTDGSLWIATVAFLTTDSAASLTTNTPSDSNSNWRRVDNVNGDDPNVAPFPGTGGIALTGFESWTHESANTLSWPTSIPTLEGDTSGISYVAPATGRENTGSPSDPQERAVSGYLVNNTGQAIDLADARIDLDVTVGGTIPSGGVQPTMIARIINSSGSAFVNSLSEFTITLPNTTSAISATAFDSGIRSGTSDTLWAAGERLGFYFIEQTSTQEPFTLTIDALRIGYTGEFSRGAGTRVVANPGGTGNTDLTSITIGTTDYDISGAGAFTDLTDTPASLGTAGQVVAVSADGMELEFTDASSAGTPAPFRSSDIPTTVAEYNLNVTSVAYPTTGGIALENLGQVTHGNGLTYSWSTQAGTVLGQDAANIAYAPATTETSSVEANSSGTITNNTGADIDLSQALLEVGFTVASIPAGQSDISITVSTEFSDGTLFLSGTNTAVTGPGFYSLLDDEVSPSIDATWADGEALRIYVRESAPNTQAPFTYTIDYVRLSYTQRGYRPIGTASWVEDTGGGGSANHPLWNSANAYSVGDIVIDDDRLFRCTTAVSASMAATQHITSSMIRYISTPDDNGVFLVRFTFTQDQTVMASTTYRFRFLDNDGNLVFGTFPNTAIRDDDANVIAPNMSGTRWLIRFSDISFDTDSATLPMTFIEYTNPDGDINNGTATNTSPPVTPDNWVELASVSDTRILDHSQIAAYIPNQVVTDPTNNLLYRCTEEVTAGNEEGNLITDIRDARITDDNGVATFAIRFNTPQDPRPGTSTASLMWTLHANINSDGSEVTASFTAGDVVSDGANVLTDPATEWLIRVTDDDFITTGNFPRMPTDPPVDSVDFLDVSHASLHTGNFNPRPGADPTHWEEIGGGDPIGLPPVDGRYDLVRATPTSPAGPNTENFSAGGTGSDVMGITRLTGSAGQTRLTYTVASGLSGLGDSNWSLASVPASSNFVAHYRDSAAITGWNGIQSVIVWDGANSAFLDTSIEHILIWIDGSNWAVLRMSQETQNNVQTGFVRFDARTAAVTLSSGSPSGLADVLVGPENLLVTPEAPLTPTYVYEPSPEIPDTGVFEATLALAANSAATTTRDLMTGTDRDNYEMVISTNTIGATLNGTLDAITLLPGEYAITAKSTNNDNAGTNIRTAFILDIFRANGVGLTTGEPVDRSISYLRGTNMPPQTTNCQFSTVLTENTDFRIQFGGSLDTNVFFDRLGSKLNITKVK